MYAARNNVQDDIPPTHIPINGLSRLIPRSENPKSNKIAAKSNWFELFRGAKAVLQYWVRIAHSLIKLPKQPSCLVQADSTLRQKTDKIQPLLYGEDAQLNMVNLVDSSIHFKFVPTNLIYLKIMVD